MNRSFVWLAVLSAAVAAAPALGQFTPQTIQVDGVNDFDANNRVEDDTIDTEEFCAPPAQPLDIGQVFMTNDSNNLYFGFEYDRACFENPAINLGIAIDVNTAAGGDTDPFARQIAWSTAPKKPDYVAYVVVDAFNFEVLYQWNDGTTSWDDITPGGSGTDALGWVNDSGFEEVAIPLGVLGVAAGDTVCVEWWVTQNENQKGPLECVMNDADQTSTPGGTVFNPPAPVELDTLFCYEVLSAVDVIPPTVEGACKIGPGLVSVDFSEPVDPATAENPFNYDLSNTGELIINAQIQPGQPDVVNLTLTGDIGASSSFYDVTVTGVRDLALNPIVENGVDNVGSFYLKELEFILNASCLLAVHGSGTDAFHVEGSRSPLTFTPCDDAPMTEQIAGSGIFRRTVEFCLPKLGAEATLDLEYKFTHDDGVNCSFESTGNRAITLSSAQGVFDQVGHYWDNNGPDALLSHDVDVIFTVDLSAQAPGPTDLVHLLGSQPPLSWDLVDAIPMADDGVPPDAAAGDDIYSVAVSFLECTFLDVGYKYALNLALECTDSGQGDRSFRLDETKGVIGSPEGPQELLTGVYDFCTRTTVPVTVRFRVDDSPLGSPPAAMELAGSQLPLTFDPPYAVQLADDGVPPDAVAGDGVWTADVTFPDSTAKFVEYKYVADGSLECFGQANRSVTLDDLSGTTQILEIDLYDQCDPVIAVGDAQPAVPAAGLQVDPAFPNPFNPQVQLRFALAEPGAVSVRVIDLAGRLVREVLAGEMAAGTYVVSWDGRDGGGRAAASGVYFLEVRAAAERVVRKVVLVE